MKTSNAKQRRRRAKAMRLLHRSGERQCRLLLLIRDNPEMEHLYYRR